MNEQVQTTIVTFTPPRRSRRRLRLSYGSAAYAGTWPHPQGLAVRRRPLAWTRRVSLLHVAPPGPAERRSARRHGALQGPAGDCRGAGAAALRERPCGVRWTVGRRVTPWTDRPMRGIRVGDGWDEAGAGQRPVWRGAAGDDEPRARHRRRGQTAAAALGHLTRGDGGVDGDEYE